MSVPYADFSAWIPWTVLLASLAGSSHCLAMCGGLALATARTRISGAAYHLGRLAGYLTLGASAGAVGSRLLLDAPEARWVSGASALMISAGFLWAAWRVWKGRTPHFSLLPDGLLAWLGGRTRGSAFGTGLLTAFLPCGWLHVFVLAAVTAKSAPRGAGFLFAFWMGTLPALSAAPWMARNLMKPLASRAPRAAAALLLAAGFLSAGGKAYTAIVSPHPGGGAAAHRCH